jgi:hypothetical protein
MNDLRRALHQFGQTQADLLQSYISRLNKVNRRNWYCQRRYRAVISFKPPRYVPHYHPMTPSPSQSEAIEIRKLISAYEASNEDLPTPMTPNKVRIIIDTGASISITNTNKKTHFFTISYPWSVCTFQCCQLNKCRELLFNMPVFTTTLAQFMLCVL